MVGEALSATDGTERWLGVRPSIVRSAWAVLLIACAVFLLVRGGVGVGVNHLTIDSNILAAIPPDSQRPELWEFMQRAQNRGEGRVGFMASGADVALNRASLLHVREHLASFIEWSDLSEGAITSLATEYIPFQTALLSAHTQSSLKGESEQRAFLDSRRELLYSAPASYYSRFITQDPLLLVPTFLSTRPRCARGLPTAEGLIEVSATGRSPDGSLLPSLLLMGTLRGDPLSREFQERFIAAATSVLATQSNPITPFGVIWFAQRIATQAETSANTVGWFAFVATCALMVAVFGSWWALMLSLVPLVTGVLVATATSFLFFDSFHVLTLALGSVLIGGCTDYAIHYLSIHSLFRPKSGASPDPLSGRSSNNAREILRLVLPGLTLGMLTTVVSYLALVATPLPILVQLATFASAGLLAAYATVVLWFPFLTPTRFALAEDGIVHRFVKSWMDWMQDSRVRFVSWTSITLLAISALYCLGFVTHTGDDVRLFSDPPSDLVAHERMVHATFGGPEPTRYIITRADTFEELLNRVQMASTALEGTPHTEICSLTDWIPTQRDQHEGHRIIADLVKTDAYRNYLEEVGLPTDSRPPPFRLLTLDDLHEPHHPSREFWLGAFGTGFGAVSRIAGVVDDNHIRASLASIPGVEFVNRAATISEILGRYRVRGTVTTLLSYLVVLFILMVRYGPRRGALCMIPPVIGVCAAIVSLTALGGSINVFTLFGLLLTLGLGVDFAVFFSEGGEHHAATLLAVAVSATTSILSTGALAFCPTPILSQFGICVSVGIGVAMIVAPLTVPRIGLLECSS